MAKWTKNDPRMLIENSVQLPNDEKAFEAVPHWVRALTEIRDLIPDADWHVNLDDFEFPWFDGLGY
jgi:phosphatidate phosphatase APP1